jgi:hypothetical protein
MEGALLVINLTATCLMAGIIWFVQIVHYPLLAMVGVGDAREIAVEHQRRTGYVVGLPMVFEGLSTLALLVRTPEGVNSLLPWFGAALLAVALGCTVLLSVPLHAQMATTPTAQTGARLVSTNWPRTVAWSLRVVVCVVMLLQLVK